MNLGFQWCKPAHTGFLIIILDPESLLPRSQFFCERDAKYEYFPDPSFRLHAFYLFFLVHLLLNRKRKALPRFVSLANHNPSGHLASGSITYTGEDSPSFWVVLFVTVALSPILLFSLKLVVWPSELLFTLPSLAYYSAHQGHWNTQLSETVAQIEGWNFKPGACNGLISKS